jgi:hypothetical protein
MFGPKDAAAIRFPNYTSESLPPRRVSPFVHILELDILSGMFGDITVKCRPLRLAFLITPNKTALRKAIQINSTLWGGTFNPIIPLYAQPPKVWKDYPRQKLAIKDRVAGYVRAFDPDFLVDCTGYKLRAYVGDLGRSTISVDEIWSKFYAEPRDGAPQYGVGIFELFGRNIQRVLRGGS